MIRRTWIQMGMPITVCIRDAAATESDVDSISGWFEEVNQRYSTYLVTSEVSRLNAGEIEIGDVSQEFTEILDLCRQTKDETRGYFDVERDGRFDPSGLVKGWAIKRASELLFARGYEHHFVDAGGDVQAVGLNADGHPWRIGIRNPFKRSEYVKVLAISENGVATSGTAIRGPHIYNPLQEGMLDSDIASLTVVASSIYDADRMATAAFAMGQDGLRFIAGLSGYEGYAVMMDGTAEYTGGFNDYVH